MRAARSLRTLAASMTLACAAALLAAQPATGAVPVTEVPAPAATPAFTPQGFADEDFRMQSVSYRAATDNLVATTLKNQANLNRVFTEKIDKDSANNPDPWLTLRKMRPCADLEVQALPPLHTVKEAYCWGKGHGDDVSTQWNPQGMSHTGTANGGKGTIEGRSALAVAWYYNNTDDSKGACVTHDTLRLTLIDETTQDYRHVLLVAPKSTSATETDFAPVQGHGGGVVWYGSNIYVTDRDKGIRVFDLNSMAKVDEYGKDLKTVGVRTATVGGVTKKLSSACGYPYVIPQSHQYQRPGNCKVDESGNRQPGILCYDWLSLDKTGGDAHFKLVTGEYHTKTGGRLVRYKLNPWSSTTTPGLLSMEDITVQDGTATKTVSRTAIHDAYRNNRYSGVQGAMTWTDGQGLMNVALNKGCGSTPSVFAMTSTADVRPTYTRGCKIERLTETTDLQQGNWAAGTPQALSYWPVRGGAQVDEIWGLTEKVCETTFTPSAREPFDVCHQRAKKDPAKSLRVIYAVGINDPEVRKLH
ncbi:hypothetical protein ABT354_25500 [Streptomyces sp. NPDC000594]|uniref:hypothetical protein n=1 Tax=Streptomyces sp. NPDC000594 TaxID=3154261 RepID=UPI0033233B78